MLDLGPRGRVTLCAVFFGCETLLIATAGMRSDRSYGFRMFPEASSIVLHVSRRLEDGSIVPIEGGWWQARDCNGAVQRFVWGKMVRPPAPWKLDAPVPAPYGVDSEVHRARDALAWVLAHTEQDCETRALIANVTARRNGRPPYEIAFEVAGAR
jgi:hypothetical protein